MLMSARLKTFPGAPGPQHRAVVLDADLLSDTRSIMPGKLVRVAFELFPALVPAGAFRVIPFLGHDLC